MARTPILIEYCEKNPADAYRTNTLSVEHASRLAQAHNVPLVYISTAGIFADPYVIPEGRRDCYAEKITYLPDTFQANDAKRRIVSRLPTRAEVGLPEAQMVLCSFNNTYKTTPCLFDIWMRALGKVDSSAWWLLGANEIVRRNLRSAAESRGIDASRLVFASNVGSAEHLARYQIADLFLDILPFNALTTASDALRGGEPVVTCAGDALAARAAGSL